MTVYDTTSLDMSAQLLLEKFNGNRELAKHMTVTVTPKGGAEQSLLLSDIWNGHVIDLGTIPDGGLDIVLKVSMGYGAGPELMNSNLSFVLKVAGFEPTGGSA
jgi:hypothetical protein